MHKAIYAAVVGAAVIAAPVAAFAQQIQPYAQVYQQPYAHAPAAATTAVEAARPDYLNTWPAMRGDRANPAVDANSVSPVFLGPRPSSAH